MCSLKDKYKGCCHNEDCESFDTCGDCWDEWAENHMVMTNADKIRAMSDEELAEFIAVITKYDVCMNPSANGCEECLFCAFCSDCIEGQELEWLQQPAEDEDASDVLMRPNGEEDA